MSAHNNFCHLLRQKRCAGNIFSVALFPSPSIATSIIISTEGEILPKASNKMMKSPTRSLCRIDNIVTNSTQPRNEKTLHKTFGLVSIYMSNNTHNGDPYNVNKVGS